MHERAFKVTTTYPFPCMVYALCRLAVLLVWYIYVFKTPSFTVDISLIRDENNELASKEAPYRGAATR